MSTDSILNQMREITAQGKGISPLFRLALVALVVISVRKKRVLADYLAGYAGLARLGAGVVAVALESKPNLFNFIVLFPLGLLWGREALALPPKPRPGLVRIILSAAFGLFALFYPRFNDGVADAVLFAPLGMVPSPSLVLALGLVILTKRAYTLYTVIPTWIVGAFYGAFGVFYLGVDMDWGLLAAAPVSVIAYIASGRDQEHPKGKRFKRKH